MSQECEKLHVLFNSLPRLKFPFNEESIPKNGIYVLFEKNENAHEGERIVRIGTHTGNNQLPSRLLQHFVNENKDRSVFRKNIGRALLNKSQDGYLKIWDFDLTTRAGKQKYSGLIDREKQLKIEQEVTRYLQENFSFIVFSVEDKERRLKLESQIISTISLCKDCKPSSDWLGGFSPKDKIREKGMWLVNELDKQPMTLAEVTQLAKDLKLQIS